jgi:hypothetical protein
MAMRSSRSSAAWLPCPDTEAAAACSGNKPNRSDYAAPHLTSSMGVRAERDASTVWDEVIPEVGEATGRGNTRAGEDNNMLAGSHL